MPALEAKRTLVKSPPEIWAEVSDAGALARHLGEFGEIRITRTQPESVVEWEGDLASGCVRLEASGWGTKVTLTAEPVVAEPEPAPEPEPQPEPEPAGPTGQGILVEPLPAAQRRGRGARPGARARARPGARAGAADRARAGPGGPHRRARHPRRRAPPPVLAAVDSFGVSNANERRILTAPAPVARAAARVAALPEQRWILTQPRDVRRSYAEEVLGHPDEPLRQQIWMLRQTKAVRESYIADVLEAPRG